MGLDGVQLVLEIEDQFGITMRDAEVQQIRTIEDIVDLIHARIESTRRSGMSALIHSFRLVKALACEVSESERPIGPRTLVADVMTPRERRLFWSRLNQLLGSPAETLRLPRPIHATIAVTIGIAGAWAVGIAIAIDYAILPAVIVMILALLWGCYCLCRGLRSVPPNGWSTFGEIAKQHLGLTCATRHTELIQREQVLTELRPIIVDVLGVEESEVTMSARLIEDLQMD